MIVCDRCKTHKREAVEIDIQVSKAVTNKAGKRPMVDLGRPITMHLCGECVQPTLADIHKLIESIQGDVNPFNKAKP